MAGMTGGWLEGQVALITGGATGIGRALVARFLEEGARVGVLVRDEGQAETLSALGDRVVPVVGDVRSPVDNQKAVAATVAAFGRLDTFVGNVGIWDYLVSVEALPDESIEAIFDDIFAVNVKGYVLGAKAAIPELRKTRGSMVFTASTSSFFTGGGGGLYVASKHAVIGLIKQLAYELAPDIRVNGVAPGGTRTPLSGSVLAGHAGRHLSALPGLDEFIGRLTPLGRIAEPEDHVAHYVLLASTKNSAYTTGTIILSDGGIGVGKRPD
jgi:NAD(P)-dependent dehydrogenase (short-subunit alcohol dehydrogenase family)